MERQNVGGLLVPARQAQRQGPNMFSKQELIDTLEGITERLSPDQDEQRILSLFREKEIGLACAQFALHLRNTSNTNS